MAEEKKLRVGFVHPDLGIGELDDGVRLCRVADFQAVQSASLSMPRSHCRGLATRSSCSPRDMTPLDASRRLVMVSSYNTALFGAELICRYSPSPSSRLFAPAAPTVPISSLDNSLLPLTIASPLASSHQLNMDASASDICQPADSSREL